MGQFFRVYRVADRSLPPAPENPRNEKPLPKGPIKLAGYKGIYSCECDFRRFLILAK